MTPGLLSNRSTTSQSISVTNSGTSINTLFQLHLFHTPESIVCIPHIFRDDAGSYNNAFVILFYLLLSFSRMGYYIT